MTEQQCLAHSGMEMRLVVIERSQTELMKEIRGVRRLLLGNAVAVSMLLLGVISDIYVRLCVIAPGGTP